MEPRPEVPEQARPEEPISVRGPAALAAALRYLYPWPLNSTAVVAAIRPDSTLAMSASSPMPPFPQGASPEVVRQWACDVGRLAAQGALTLGAADGHRLAVVLYLPVALGQPPQWFAATVMEQGAADVDGLLDVIAVFGDRWRSLACTNEACCPTTGAVILHNSDAALVAAELVGAGMTVASGEPRSAISDEVADILAAMPYPSSMTARRRLLRQAWPVVRRAGEIADAGTIAMLIMAADRPGVRDALLRRMAARSRDSGFWLDQSRLWSSVVQASADDWVPGPACMCAIAAWAQGDAASAVLAIRAALDAEPGHRMAFLLWGLLAQGKTAAEWFDRMQGIAEGDCLRFDRPPPPTRSSPAQHPRVAS